MNISLSSQSWKKPRQAGYFLDAIPLPKATVMQKHLSEKPKAELKETQLTLYCYRKLVKGAAAPFSLPFSSVTAERIWFSPLFPLVTNI